MTFHEKRSIKPFVSVMLIIATLLAVVFVQMEERRMSYTVMKFNRELKHDVDQKRLKEVYLAKVTRPQLLDQVAQNRLTLKKINSKQIIHLGTAQELLASVNSESDVRGTKDEGFSFFTSKKLIGAADAPVQKRN